MNLTLTRSQFRSDGIFGVLKDESGNQIAVTLEHSFDEAPAVPSGTYTCQRGEHLLAKMRSTFETFEVLNVPGHSGILFHIGNFNSDSEGCILLGSEVVVEEDDAQMISNSRNTFNAFMELQMGVDQFILTIV